MITSKPFISTISSKRRSAVMRSAGVNLMLYGGLNIALIGVLSLTSRRPAWHGVTDAMAFFTMLLFWISVMGVALWRIESFQPKNLVLRLIAAKPRKTPPYQVVTMALVVFVLPILIMAAVVRMKIFFLPPMQLISAAGGLACAFMLVYGAVSYRSAEYFRRHEENRCINCGYDLRASVGQCPECGLACHPV